MIELTDSQIRRLTLEEVKSLHPDQLYYVFETVRVLGRLPCSKTMKKLKDELSIHISAPLCSLIYSDVELAAQFPDAIKAKQVSPNDKDIDL